MIPRSFTSTSVTSRLSSSVTVLRPTATRSASASRVSPPSASPAGGAPPPSGPPPPGAGLAAPRDQKRLRLRGVPAFGVAGRRVLAAVGAALALGRLLLAGVGRGYLDLDARVGLLEALGVGLGARHDVDAAILEVLPQGFGDLRVLERHEAVQDLDDGHLGAEVLVHARELDPDGAGAKDDHALRIPLVVRDDVVAGDDLLPVELEPRQRVHRGSRGGENPIRP